MGKSSLLVERTPRFEKEAEQFLEADAQEALAMLVWAITRNPYYGQRVKGCDRWVGVIYRAGFAYLVYYSMAGRTLTFESVLRRTTPISPGPLGLES